MSSAPPSDPLPPRLREIARHVLVGQPMADIGTDHALLPTCLVHEGTVPSAIAIDSRSGPLQHARVTIDGFGVRDVEVRLGDGLQPLRPDEVATVVLAGLGGAKIMALVDAWPASAALPRLILQPNTDWAGVRRWVAQRGYALVEETMITAAGHFYITLVLCPRTRTAHSWADDPEAWTMGPLLRHSQPVVWSAWIETERERLLRALDRARAAGALELGKLERSLARLDRYLA